MPPEPPGPDKVLSVPLLFDGDNWHRGVRIGISRNGEITTFEADTDAQPGDQRVRRVVIPGMPNLHSHAFQRAMAGFAEIREAGGGSFWGWRQVMYRVASQISLEAMEVVATHLYVELLKAGYTSVCEFHYLHRDGSGGTPGAMSEALVRAADSAGIGLTLLPVLYQHGGFGTRPLDPTQQQFHLDTPEYLELRSDLAQRCGPQLTVGTAIHSLRAVAQPAMEMVIDGWQGPIHIHVAEQPREVQECLDFTGQRPVEWLASRLPLDQRWVLVHATHVTQDELGMVAEAGATVGLCPSTEANLGDGLFPLGAWLQLGGGFGVGSDSNVSRCPVEELRWLEYGQRLHTGQRNLADGAGQGTGRQLWRRSLAGGARACGRAVGMLGPGGRADLLVLDPQRFDPADGPDQVLERLVFSGNNSAVVDVMAGGHWTVQAGRHLLDDDLPGAFRSFQSELLKGPR